MQQRKRITITVHAKQRLTERAPEIAPRDYQTFVSSARYTGYTKEYLRKNYPEVFKYVFSHYHSNNSTEIRVYKKYVFIFCGNSHSARTLRTVSVLPEKIYNFF